MVHKKLFRVSCVLYYPSAKQRWIVQGILDSLNQSGTKTRDLNIFSILTIPFLVGIVSC